MLLEETSMITSEIDLVGLRLSEFYVEKHEYPCRSKAISTLPIRVWVLASKEGETIEIYVGPAGCSVEVRTGTPEPVDMSEYGRTLLLPQFLDETLRAQCVLRACTEPFGDGEKLMLQLSDGSELSYACNGDDELRPSIDQSKI